MAEKTKTLAWSDERSADLAAWIVRGLALGVDMTAVRPNGAKSQDVSHSAAIGAALRRATACRCGERRCPVKTPLGRCDLPCGPGGELCSGHATDGVAPIAGANPLRALREAAGLTQKQAAERVGISRGAWANAEKAATATADMVARARKAIGGGK